MSNVNSSVDTVNAAAAAIISAESRVQPTSGEKRSWGSFWSRYWCFGSHKNTKRIGHASLFPEPVENNNVSPPAPVTSNSTSIVRPFIAPPSSPASFLQSDPPTAAQSPGGTLTLASLAANAYSPGGPANIFAIGPYAHETQLVSPPVFSAFPTEPSTATVTPPPEPMQSTTPSSPEVPFAELLTKSLNRPRRNSGPNHRLALSYYEIHQFYSGSPASNLRSPGSATASGTSSPYPDRHSILELRIADASKLFDAKMFSTHKWGSRLGSGSLTPDGVGSASRDSLPRENQISDVASLANSETGSQHGEPIVDHRLSFELANEDIPTCTEKKEPVVDHRLSFELDNEDIPTCVETMNHVVDHRLSFELANENTPTCSKRKEPRPDNQEVNLDESCDGVSRKEEISCVLCRKEFPTECTKTALQDPKDCKHKNSSISLGSVKEFNFDSTDKDATDKSTISTPWWEDDKADQKEMGSHGNWTFFPLLQPGVS